MEICVAIGAVNRGGEFSVQRNGAADGVEREVRRIGFAPHFDLVELAGILAGGGERASDTREWIEVGVVEAIGAGNGREGGIFSVPGTESSPSGNFAFGLG